MPTKKSSFPVFFMIWAESQGWRVPDFHVAVCDWLENRGPLALLMLPRGHAKSSILDVYNAWRFYIDPLAQILHQGSTDPDAYKVSRGTERVLETHPLCVDCKKVRGETQRWWVDGASDVRYGSIYARGITSTVTGHRATEIQNDDVEVPQNIATPDAREKLRYRLSEQTHILIPGGTKLFVGTPHTHDSIYEEIKAQGADCLCLSAFGKEQRYEEPAREYAVSFKPEYVFSGIGAHSMALREGFDYTYHNGKVVLSSQPKGMIDFYSDALWPDRFTPMEMEKRRRECRTINEWDSQYMLRAQPIHNIRLNPDKIKWYDCQPEFVMRNGSLTMTLGNVKITSSRAYWDVALGRVGGDDSVLSVVFGDDEGNLYWHTAQELHGELDAQCEQVAATAKLLCLANVIVESNGVGGFVAAKLRQFLMPIGCSVTEKPAKGNKNERIIQAIEPAISGGFLWAHRSLIANGVSSQMRDWQPITKNKPDDFLDSGAGAILANPVRIGRNRGARLDNPVFRPQGQTYEAEFSHASS